jgi:hypothetical protein
LSRKLLIAIAAVVVLAGSLIAAFSLGRSGRTVVGAIPAATPATTGPVTTAKPGHGHERKVKFAYTTAAPPQVQALAGLPALRCPTATVIVHDSAGFQAALKAAHPGTVIRVEDGLYYGRFQGTGAGTRDDPIWVCGGPMAILDDSQRIHGSPPPEHDGAYGFHLVNASWWNLVGFSVRNAQKGVVLDHSSYNILYSLIVYNVGDEAIHLREFSSDNLVEGSVIRDTGLEVAFYGEGVYLGSSVNNWPNYTGGKPDTSNYNKVLYNNISNATAENVDVKEGTTGGELAFNHFDGTGMVTSAATAWVNVKGNGYAIHDNTGQVSVGDGFSTHKIVSGSGTGNVFSDNHIGEGVTGYGFAFHSDGNTLKCDNTGRGQKGRANVSCTG